MSGQQTVDNQLTDGGNVVSAKHQPHFTLQKRYFSASGTHSVKG
jgi:hypothetical protein